MARKRLWLTDAYYAGTAAYLQALRAAAMARRGDEEAATQARAMAEWAAVELRAVGLNVSVEIKRGDPHRVLLEEAQK